jgi:protein-tyrosine phosphatase
VKRTLAAALVTSVMALPTLLVTPAGAQGAKIREATVDCSAGTECTVTWEPAIRAFVYVDDQPDVDVSSPPLMDGVGTVTVGGLDPATRYYFGLTRDLPAPDDLVVADRSLHLESAPNARDIGGYETKDGRHVKWGTVFRTDALSATTPADDAKLANLGVKIVCDFRGPTEVAVDGSDRIPPGAEAVNLSVLDANADKLATEVREAITSGDREAQQRLLGNGRGAKLLTQGGEFFATDPLPREQFAALLERLTDPAALPAVTHCTAGKDRTGWSTALVLTALGVPKQTVIRDYLLSNEYLKQVFDDQLEAIQALNGLPELVRPVLEVRKEYLQAGFDAVEEEYGSFARYLRKGLGIDKQEHARLKKNLLA